MSKSCDTIAAQATPVGRGGVGIIRISGPKAAEIAQAMLGKIPRPRYAEYVPFLDQNNATIDVGLALYFPAPHSFTGEDVLELQAHGGTVILDMILQTVFIHGARQARPGEFSERAFLNDKLDLVQAEAIADLIEAGTAEAARAALRSLQGEFSRVITNLVDDVTQLRIYVEAAIDFPEEEIDFLVVGQVETRLQHQLALLQAIKTKAQQGSILKEGIHVVLAGQPNAGKSSLLNALSGRDTAIVTPIAGTTRDVIREEINLDGVPLHIIDTAGLHASDNLVEQEGMRRTWQAIEQADCIVLLVDDTRGWMQADEAILQQLPKQLPVIVVHTKIDLTKTKAGLYQVETDGRINLSSKSGEGLAELTQALKKRVGFTTIASGAFAARRRHLVAIANAEQGLEQALIQVSLKRGDLIAEELRQVQLQLGEITGAISSDDLLGKIFSSFCIGK